MVINCSNYFITIYKKNELYKEEKTEKRKREKKKR